MWETPTNFEKVLDTDQKEGLQLPEGEKAFENKFKDKANRLTLVNTAAKSFAGLDQNTKDDIKTKAKTEISSRTAFPNKETDKEAYGAKIAVLYLYTTLDTPTIKNPSLTDVQATYNDIIWEKRSTAEHIQKMAPKTIDAVTTEYASEKIPVPLETMNSINSTDKTSIEESPDKEPTKLYEDKDPNIIFSTATAIHTYKPWDIIVWKWKNSGGYNEVYRRDGQQNKYVWVNADAKATTSQDPEYFNNINDFNVFKNDRQLWHEVTKEDIQNAPKIMGLGMIVPLRTEQILKNNLHLSITKEDNFITISNTTTSWNTDNIQINEKGKISSLNNKGLKFKNSTHIRIDETPDINWWYTMKETDITGNVTEVKIRVKPEKTSDKIKPVSTPANAQENRVQSTTETQSSTPLNITDTDIDTSDEIASFKQYLDGQINFLNEDVDIQNTWVSIRLGAVQESRPDNSFVDIICTPSTNIKRNVENMIKSKIIKAFPDADTDTITFNSDDENFSFGLSFKASIQDRINTTSSNDKVADKMDQKGIDDLVKNLNQDMKMTHSLFSAQRDESTKKIVCTTKKRHLFESDDVWYRDPTAGIKEVIAKDIGNFNNHIAYDVGQIYIADDDVITKQDENDQTHNEKRVSVKKYSLDPAEYKAYLQKTIIKT